MIIYNVTMKVNHSIQEEWLLWQKEIHIPEIMATGCFEKCQMSRLLETDETEGPTYTVQFYAAEKAQYDRYISSFATKLRKDTQEKWADQLVGFRSLMVVVH